MTGKTTGWVMLLAVVVANAATVRADVIDKVKASPVEAIGSMELAVPTPPHLEGLVNYKPGGKISFYIPLSASHSGIYGVTDVGWGKTAGTSPDVGFGTGLAGEPALRLFLQFDPVTMRQADRAALSMKFKDLDLSGAADPSHFYEAVQIRDALGRPVTPLIDTMGQLPGLDDPYPFSVTGNKSQQNIEVHDVLPLLTDGQSTWFEVDFWSRADWPGINSVETLEAELRLYGQEIEVPEPTGMVLAGLGGLVILLRRG